MATEAQGYGQGGVNRYCFALTFDQDLSSLCTYHAYDNNQTFPAMEASILTTHVNEVFTHGFSATNNSMIMLIDTTNAEPSDTWGTTLATGGGSDNEANPNFIGKNNGDANDAYVEQDGSILETADLMWNMLVEVDTAVELTDDMRFELVIRFTFTGPVPTPVWGINVGSAPTTWQAMTPGVEGIKHCNAAAGAAGTLKATIPASGQELTAKAFSCVAGE